MTLMRENQANNVQHLVAQMATGRRKGRQGNWEVKGAPKDADVLRLALTVQLF
jgi:hypothetical protein